MKKIVLSVASLLLATYITAQTPDAFNYQAVARDANGTAIGKQAISMQISIVKGEELIYTEDHKIETNEFGLFTLNIGQGLAVLGDFSTIDWSTGDYSLSVGMDEKGGADYVVMGTTKLLTVPYAMHAKTAENVFSGDYNDLTNLPEKELGGEKAAADPWLNGGNAGTTNGVDFVGTTDEEDLDFRVNDVIHFRMTENGQLEVLNSGGSVFLGQHAGKNDDLSSNKNVFVGTSAGTNNTTGQRNIAIGYWSMFSNTTGSFNTASGSYSLRKNTTGSSNVSSGNFSMYNNTTGANNIGLGDYALFKNSTGSSSTAVGSRALFSNTSGGSNVGVGFKALEDNSTGSSNTAVGFYSLNENTASGNSALGKSALEKNTSGSSNTGVGLSALSRNTEGDNNTSVGSGSLALNTEGDGNVAVGKGALNSNTEGHHNVGLGLFALSNNTTGDENIALGYAALNGWNTGDRNIAIGYSSLETSALGSSNIGIGCGAIHDNWDGNSNVAVGENAIFKNLSGTGNVAVGTSALQNNISGSSNVAIGQNAGLDIVNRTNAVVIGFNAVSEGSNTATIGNADMTIIGGYANWLNLSDGRFKTNVTENVGGLDFIMKLRPVTYNLDMDAIAKFNDTPDSIRNQASEFQKASEVQVGFIAQEVELAANQSNFDFHGVEVPKNDESRYGLRYAEFVPPLVKAVQEQQETIEAQKQLIDQLIKRLEDLESEKSE